MNATKQLQICAIMLLVVGQVAYAQENIQKQAQVGFRFLENPADAEAVGRGGFGITNLHNASAVFWNPAGMAWMPSRIDLGLHYYKGFADINQTSFALAGSGRWGVIALSARVMDYGIFYGTRRAEYTVDDAVALARGYVETGSFTPQAHAFGVAYARVVNDRCSFGVHLKRAFQNLTSAYILNKDITFTDTTSTVWRKKYHLTVPVADIGAYYNFKFLGITFGAVAENISEEVEYEDAPFPLPFAMRFGSSLRLFELIGIDASRHDLLIGIETRHGRDFGEKVHLGLEYSLFDAFFVRAGYMGNYSEKGATLGFGLHHEGIHFDYALQDYGLLGIIHIMSIGYSMGG